MREGYGTGKPMNVYRGDTAEARRLQRRTRLIEAARRVFSERGFHNATVRVVCEAAELTERYFYESFPNSEALFIAMHKDTSERILREIARAGGACGGSPEERLRAMLTAYYEDILRDPGSAQLFAVDAAYISPTAREVCATWRQAYGLLLAQALGAGGAGNPIVRHAVIRALLGIGVDWMEGGFAISTHEIVAAAMQVAKVLRDA